MATTVTLGKLRFDVKGDYTTSTQYYANDIVTYRNQQYICTVNVNSTSTGEITPLGTNYWTTFGSLFNFRGTWTVSTSYLVGDIVNQVTSGTITPPGNTSFSLSRSIRRSYICTQPHVSSTSINPIDTGYWATFNSMATLNTQTSAGAATGTYRIGSYSENHYGELVLANRGIAFDANPYYKGGGYKNTVESLTCGYISNNGQCMTWGTGETSSLGMLDNTQCSAVMNLTFTFYDWWRSTSNGGTGVHSTPDGQTPRVLQWEKSYNGNTVLMNSGEVFAWGYGANGENGDGGTTNRGLPVRVGGTLANVFAVSTANHLFYNVRIKRIAMSGGCGTPDDPRHTLALDENGQVWTWGYNGYGQLGDNTTTSKNVPTLIPKSAFGNKDIVAIWAFGNRTGWSGAVDTSGSLWMWGYNVNGQLGLGDTNNRSVPVNVSGLSFGGAGVGNIIKINHSDRWNGSTGEGCTVILTDTGRVYATGLQGSGWIGLGTTTQQNAWINVGSGPGNSVSSVASDMWLMGSGGNRVTLYVRSSADNVLYSCGYSARGQLARGGSSTTSQSTFDKCKMSIAGSLYDMVNVTKMAFSGEGDVCSVLAINSSGLGFGAGDNNVGQLANGTANQFQTWSDSNLIEETANYAFQLVRGPSDMVGNLDDVMGFGRDATNYYFVTVWVNKEGRVMVNGRGNQQQTTQYFAGTIDSVNCTTMTPLISF
jgi:YD repeat-containing protein